MPELPNIPKNITKLELVKYLNVILALLKKLQDKEGKKLEELEEKLEEKIKSFSTIKGDKGEKGEKGDSPDVSQIISEVLALVPTPKDGKDGRDGKDGKDGKDFDESMIAEFATKQAILEVLSRIPRVDTILTEIEQNLPKFGTKYRDALELLQGDERLDIKAIKGFEDEFIRIEKMIKELPTVFVGGSSSGGRIVKSYDLSSQLNGVTKTFSLPAFWRIISVHSSSFPNAFRETVDYTYDASVYSITFTSEITADTTLATGQTITIIYSE